MSLPVDEFYSVSALSQSVRATHLRVAVVKSSRDCPVQAWNGTGGTERRCAKGRAGSNSTSHYRLLDRIRGGGLTGHNLAIAKPRGNFRSFLSLRQRVMPDFISFSRCSPCCGIWAERWRPRLRAVFAFPELILCGCNCATVLTSGGQQIDFVAIPAPRAMAVVVFGGRGKTGAANSRASPVRTA
jgi:hypothetical protein